LGDALRRAGRPARDAMPASADAVLFADRAELLACAARDACRKEERWWWKHLLDDAVTPSSVAREWQRTPEAIPAAAELLGGRGGAARAGGRTCARAGAARFRAAARTREGRPRRLYPAIDVRRNRRRTGRHPTRFHRAAARLHETIDVRRNRRHRPS